MLASFIMLIAAEGAVSLPAPAPFAEPDPKKMSRAEINAHNARLTRDHPYHIRCVKAENTGSLVKRRQSCRTNAQWAAADEAGNREARDIADRMSSKTGNSN
jgi:hypothetical protein